MSGETFRYIEHIYTTPETFSTVTFIKSYATESEKIEFFKVFNSQNIPTKLYESVFFQLKTLIKVPLEKFSDVV